MAQISRPFQIAFVAMALFALVWLLALRGHSTTTGGSGSSAPAPSSSTATTGGVVHGTAPGVEGLSRAIAKAHGAVTNSQQSARQLQERSARASNEKVSPSSGGTTAPKAAAPTAAKTAPASAAPSAASPTRAGARTATPGSSAAKAATPKPVTPAAGLNRPTMQVKVEAELRQGKTVAILFWNPKATDDQAVSHQLQSVGHKLHASVAVHAALASQVGAFGTIIRGVKVYGTPTVMIINQRGQAATLTGYTDAYAIEQAISEARHAPHR
ncbi:MAG TPA: hypothetical protein VGO14_02630 [Solirubrobacteraceae bacterium]|nr:hypothetical protein [Solirubrobacteraceae bacterium]